MDYSHLILLTWVTTVPVNKLDEEGDIQAAGEEAQGGDSHAAGEEVTEGDSLVADRTGKKKAKTSNSKVKEKAKTSRSNVKKKAKGKMCFWQSVRC